jgi:Tfp pilus assembly protein PilN
MALDFFSTYYKGIAFDFLDDGSYLLNYIEISKSREKLSIVKSQEQLKDVKNIETKFEKEDIVQVHLLGKGIVYKAIEATSIADLNDVDKLISLVLPNADAKEFLVNTYPVKNLIYIAICRKSFVDEILTLLQEFKCTPINIYIGPFYIDVMLPFINVVEPIQLNSYTLFLEHEGISTIKKENNTIIEQKFKIENNEISSNVLVLFSSVLLLELKTEGIALQHPLTIDFKRTVLFKKKYKKYLFNTISVFFLLLLINFVVYSYLFNVMSANTRNSEQQAKQSELKIQEMNEYKFRKKFIEDKNWNKPHLLAEYIESIMKSAPKGLSIKSLNYQLNNSKKNKLELVYNKIYINGVVVNSNQLNKWMKSLGSLDLFKDVELISYTTNYNTNDYSFNLEIEL